MKSNRWFNRQNRLFSVARIASASALFIAAVIAFIAASNISLLRAGSAQTYIVIYNTQSVSADAAATIAKAGGTLVASYDAIGVVIARSDNDAFRTKLLKNSNIHGVAPTDKFATQLPDENDNDTSSALITPNTTAPGNDHLPAFKGDMTTPNPPDHLPN